MRDRVVLLAGLLLIVGLQCRGFAEVQLTQVPVETARAAVVEAPTATVRPTAVVEVVSTAIPAVAASPTMAPTVTVEAADTATVTPSVTPAPTQTPLPHALYCTEPPEDYTRVVVGQHTISARTLAMLNTAQAIYEGPGDIMRLTQGSYRDVVEASFGTHAGGGAVDISIRDPQNEAVFLWNEAEAMVQALRYAGFAAWFRDVGDLGEGSAAHIHAIAVGDGELSEAAQGQVMGEGGYLAGMDGLIAPYGPNVDGHGGPVVCDWMR